MLHGMIPAAFFATLLRRYLDSLAETPECVSEPYNIGYLGTSAAIAAAGIALYGLRRFSQKDPSETPTGNNNLVIPIPQNDNSLRVRKKRPRSRIRKRHRRGKQWFMKNMRHYKSKYGRQIGKLMNQLLGVPFTESPVEPLHSDNSEDDSEVFGDELDNMEGIETSQENQIISPDDPFLDNFPFEMPVPMIEDDLSVSKDDFDDDDESKITGGNLRSQSSSLDLKDLLRENFERQSISRRSSRRSSSGSDGSLKSSASRRSSGSPKSPRKYSSRKSLSSSRYHRGKNSRNDGNCYQKSRKIYKKTRSGRCYDEFLS